MMLGVRRSSVTDAIHILEGDLLIKASAVDTMIIRFRSGAEVVRDHRVAANGGEREPLPVVATRCGPARASL